jgi:hypothetical protein
MRNRNGMVRLISFLRRITVISVTSVLAFSFLTALPASAATPNAPTNVALHAWTNSSTAVVTWTAPNPVTGVTITGYTVTSNPGAMTCTVAASSTSCSVPGLTSSTSYTFSVFASSTGGNGPSASSVASSSPALTTSTTTLSASPNSPQNVGSVIDLSAIVTSGATGTVEFMNGSSAITGCATVVLNSAYAGCSTSGLPSGSDALSAVYSGDTNYSGSTSSTLYYTVSSSTLAAPSSPLVITTIDAPINTSPVTLATSGGNGSGAISFSVTNGTATGCAISSGTISVPTNVSGTCYVTAAQASTSSYLGESSNVTAFNFFWQYAATWTTYISSYSCGTGATLSWNGSSYVCTYTATPTCPNGGTLEGSNCVTQSSTVYISQCVNNSSGTAVWTSLSYNAPYYGYCTWTLAATQTCPNGGSLSGTTCTYAATPNYSSYWACPFGGTASATICSISGGSGPNLRRSDQRVATSIRARVRDYSTKGTP